MKSLNYQACLMKILSCFKNAEGTLYDEYWTFWGITEKEKEHIIKEYKEYIREVES